MRNRLVDDESRSNTPWEKQMKRRLLLALAGLAISFAVPAFAQQKEPTPNEHDRQWLEI